MVNKTERSKDVYIVAAGPRLYDEKVKRFTNTTTQMMGENEW